MGDRVPTMRSREIGTALRQALQKVRLNASQAADQLGWTPGWVSRLLSGKRNATELHVAAFLALCRVTGAERDRLLALSREQHVPGWLQQFGSRLPQQVVTLVDHEDKAVTISEFQSTLVPGLLQTAAYTRALLTEAGRVPVAEIDDRAAARLARQGLFSREHPARFTFFIHEFVLRLPIGGPAVMFDQLSYLLRMVGRPHVTLRVVPAALGGHAGTGGSFKLMEFPEVTPVAYLDSETSCLFLELPAEIAAYRSILGALAGTALGEGESHDLIAALAQELYADRE
ncbi:MAG: helix-turn-helix domain-containing protein [Pseudonocardiales bacterium]